MGKTWREVAESQCGVLSEKSLREVKVTRAFVRNQIAAGRWAERTHSVYTTTTGPLSRDQLLWVALEHAGPRALLGGLTAAEQLGMRNWANGARRDQRDCPARAHHPGEPARVDAHAAASAPRGCDP